MSNVPTDSENNEGNTAATAAAPNDPTEEPAAENAAMTEDPKTTEDDKPSDETMESG